MMKRILCLLLALLISVQLAGCGGTQEPSATVGPDAGLTDADIYGTWYASPEMGGAEVTINKDGTCLIYGQSFNWSVWEENEREIQLGCENGVHLTIYNLDKGLPLLFCDDFGTMVRSAQLWQYHGSWETDFGQRGHIDEYTIQFTSDESAHIQISEDGDSVVCVITESSGTQIHLTMHYVDGYPVIEYTDSTGAMELYYNADNRPPVDTQEVLYREAIKKLNTVLEGGRIHYDDTNMTIDGCNAYAYIHGLFERLGDYKDAKQYLANFKVIEDVLVDIREPGEAFNTNLLYVYGEHDDQGRRLTGKVIPQLRRDIELGFYACGDFYQLTYGEDGLVSEILTHNGDEQNVIAVGIPSYDAQGNMISLDVTWNNPPYGVFTYTSYFTYDEHGRRLTYEIPDVLNEQVSYGRYYYDADGKLLQITENVIKYGKKDPTIRTIDEYVYDDNGALIEHRLHSYMPAYPDEWTFTVRQYSNDPAGKPQSIVWSGATVYRCLDGEGNIGALRTGTYGHETEEDYVFDAVMDYVFGRQSWEMVEHNWLIDTTQMELEWGWYDKDSKTYEDENGYENVFIYTDVYLYCPEN